MNIMPLLVWDKVLICLKGQGVLHILAAADHDTDVTFKAGGKEFPLTIGGWSGYMGSWDNREFEGFVAELSYSLRNES
jgi:hypothetical protein